MTDHTPTPDTMCTCGHGAASAHDIDNSVSAFTACVVSGCTCKAFTPAPEAATRAVRGYCPACGWETLFLGDGGYITCARLNCPTPDAASTLLETDPRTTAEAPATNPCRADGLHRFATHDIEVCDRDRARATAERAAHEEHRRSLALLHDLPAHADWLQVTAAVTATLRDLAAERAAHEAHRLAVSEALGLGTSTPWGAMIGQARKLAADPLRRMLDSPVAGVADLAAAAREQADEAHEEYRRQLADVLGEARGHGWGHLIGRAATVRTAATDPRPRCTCAGVGSGAGDCAAHRQPEPDAEPEPDCPGHETSPNACTCTCTCEGCRHNCAAHQPAAPDPQPREVCCVCGCPDVTYHNYRDQPFCCRCAECCDPPKLCAHGCQPPKVEPQPDGAALWAAIRDHAFNDTQWWRKVNQRQNHAQLNTYVQRGPGHTPTR